MDKLKRFQRFAEKVHRALPKKYRVDVYVQKQLPNHFDSTGNYIGINSTYVKRHFDYSCIALLHEYGHKINRTEKLINLSKYDYHRFWYEKKLSNKRLNDELLAWCFALQLYDVIKPNFPQKTLYKMMNRCLKAYERFS